MANDSASQRAWILAYLGILSVIGGTAWLSAGGPMRAEAVGPPAANVKDRVNTALGLRDSVLAAVSVTGNPGAAVSTVVPLGAGPHTLELTPHSARAANYRIMVQNADGSYADVPPGPVRTYRGRVRGIEGSAVAASMESDGLHAKILLPDGTRYWVEPAALHVPDAAANAHVVYTDADILPSVGQCAVAAAAGLGGNGDVGTEQQIAEPTAATAGAACGTGLCIAQLACDADYEYYLSLGSVSAVEDRINSVINAMNVQYERDVSIRHAITTIIVRTSSSDPYTSTDPNAVLNEVTSHWQSNHGNVQRDLVELFTGKSLDGSTIGIAWIGVVCSNYGYSVVESNFTSNFGLVTDLSAHELGHNWNAGHCSCGNPGYTMNPSITGTNRFHPDATIPTIVSYRDARSGCLTPGDACSVDADCDDGLFCNGVETCSAGSCLPGVAVNCDDGNACTDDGCDEASGCAHTAVDCDDGNPCTTDSCDPLSGCDHDPVVCPPGQTCEGGVCQEEICDQDGVCEGDEDCSNCPTDCISGGGASFCGNGVCEPGIGEDCVSCAEDCRGKQNGKGSQQYCCGDGDGNNPVDCSDPRCSADPFVCDDSPVDPYCCGDGVCEGDEDGLNCALDCLVPCGTSAECDDGDACTTDACVGGMCTHEAIECDDGNACTSDACDPASGQCVHEAVRCEDGNDCSVDTCDPVAGCSNDFPACGLADGCCGPECGPADDPDCCGERNTPCSSDAECCSGMCKNNGTCR